MGLLTGNSIYGSPAIGKDGTIYFGSADNNLYAVNSVDGSIKWTFTADDEIKVSPALDLMELYRLDQMITNFML